jgi:protein-disulfide isomerase
MHANIAKDRISWACLLIATATSMFTVVTAAAEPALGSDHAPVTIVEYGSLTCDYCVRFHREVLPLIKTHHIDSGRVRFVYRDFPTSAAATRGAIAARCIGDQYYTMLDALYATVGSWSREWDVDTALIQQAVSLGLADAQFRACLDDSRHLRAIVDGQRNAKTEYGVVGTPTFLVNGTIVRGPQDFDQIELLIQQTLSGTPKQNSGE